jgi:hypothetical protein
MRHRGTDVAIVACLFLGGSALSMIPLGLLGSLLSPMDIPPWRTGAVLAGALVVGAGMLSLARFLRRGSGWARRVGIAVLAACTLAIGLFTFMVATSPDAGHGAGYVLLGGLQVGGFTLAGCIGLATRGSAADFDRSRIARHEAKPARLDAVAETTSGTRTFAELLIDCEEDRTLRAVLVGMLRESDG